MNVLYRDVYIVQEVRIEFNSVAGAHEDHNFLRQVLP